MFGDQERKTKDPRGVIMLEENKDKRESGQPGGGAGRKDEVGRSGVYPMSGPHPRGNAEIRGQASWGQGERGAAGYEDHGGSELSFEGGELLGGFNIGPGGEPQPHAPVNTGEVDVPHDQWQAFLDGFSGEHMNWLATVEVADPMGRLILVKERRLKGVSFDQGSGHERAYVQIGSTPEEHMTHTVERPTRITIQQTQTGAHKGLEVASADGSITLIRFRSPIRPEMLDDIVA